MHILCDWRFFMGHKGHPRQGIVRSTRKTCIEIPTLSVYRTNDRQNVMWRDSPMDLAMPRLRRF